MPKVYALGVGQTPVAKHEGKTLKSLAVEACRQAMRDGDVSDVDAIFVGNMMSSQITGQAHLGPLVAAELTGRRIESVTVNAACASGAAAVRQAFSAVASGEYETVLAVGVEKMTAAAKSEVTRVLASAADYDREVTNEATFVALNALLMQRYLHEYHVTRDDFAVFSQVAHENAVSNPNARLRAGCTLQDYIDSKMISDPIGLYDASPTGDGAAAIVLSSRADPLKPIRLLSSACATDSLSLQERNDPLWLEGVETSTRVALDQADKNLDEIDFFELHDAFTIMAALSLEACGFTPRGTAIRFARKYGIDRNGELPISTFGGLKARGHPVGASGAYQLVEAVLQLRGEAGANQIRNRPSVAMTQSVGGSGATAITHVLELAA